MSIRDHLGPLCYYEGPHRTHLVVIGRACWWICPGIWLVGLKERRVWRQRRRRAA